MPLEEMFVTCMKVHKDTGYKCRVSMEKECQKIYSNITREIITSFLYLTNNCEEYYKVKEINRTVKSEKDNIANIASLQKCVQIGLIDMQNRPDGDFKWILNVQDLSNGCCHLRALKTNSAVDTAQALCEIFYQHGEPSILNSGNIKGLQEIEEFKLIWPGLVFEHESIEANYQRTQGNKSVSNIIESCVGEKNITKWSFLLRYVQHQINESNTNSQPAMQQIQQASKTILQPALEPYPQVSNTIIQPVFQQYQQASNTISQQSMHQCQHASETNLQQTEISNQDDLLPFIDIDEMDILRSFKSESNHYHQLNSNDPTTHSKPKKSIAKMFTEYGKLSKKISLLMWKLDRHILSWAFTIYKINKTKEKLKIGDKLQDLKATVQFRGIVSLQRRLWRCLDEVKPSIKSHFLSKKSQNGSDQTHQV